MEENPEDATYRELETDLSTSRLDDVDDEGGGILDDAALFSCSF